LNVNRRGLLFIGIGLVAAIAAGLVVYVLATNISRGVEQAGPAVPTPQVSTSEVVFALVDIAPRTVITSSMLTTADYPADLVRTDTFTNTEQVIGLTARAPIYKGVPIIASQVLTGSGRSGISSVIEKGKVLVAFPANDILNSSVALQPGDRVDILLTIPLSGTARLDASAETESQVQGGQRDIVSQKTIQNVEVYPSTNWVPTSEDAEAVHNAAVLTFLVDHQEALILKYVKDSGGTIDMVVRSLEEAQDVWTEPVNLDFLVDTYHFISLPPELRTTPTPQTTPAP
jgi:pilus assembly protein CpaB